MNTKENLYVYLMKKMQPNAWVSHLVTISAEKITKDNQDSGTKTTNSIIKEEDFDGLNF